MAAKVEESNPRALLTLRVFNFTSSPCCFRISEARAPGELELVNLY